MSEATPAEPARLPVGTRVVAGSFLVSGSLHLVRPGLFEPLVPRWLPGRRAIVYASGVAELVCAAGLVTRRSWAPLAGAALLVAVWPGNWTMALEWQRSDHVPAVAKAAAWARLPLQVPMVVASLRSPVRGR